MYGGINTGVTVVRTKIIVKAKIKVKAPYVLYSKVHSHRPKLFPHPFMNFFLNRSHEEKMQKED